MNLKETAYFGLFFTCLLITVCGLGLSYVQHAQKQLDDIHAQY
ncbi:MAG: hypothetical protein WD068_00190 [Candidatus Babeliales bacterium]